MERDSEAAASERLERMVAGVADQLRRLARRIEEEAAPNIENARNGATEYSTYGRVAERVVHEVTWGVANLSLANVIDAASEAAAARIEKAASAKDATPTTNRKNGSVQALRAMLTVLDGWIQGAQENHEAMGHRGENRGEECWRRFYAEDIRNMVNDAAREVGIAEYPAPKKPREDARS